MREISDSTPVFTITWLNQTGEEATVTGTPTITIKKYDAATNTWSIIINGVNMTQETGSTYYYEWNASTAVVDTDYRVFYNAIVDTLNVESTEDIRFIAVPVSQADIQELRKGNQRIDFTFATVQNVTRKVLVGTLDYMTIYLKADSAIDWAAPTSTKILYFWYDDDGNTISVKESD